MEDFQVLNSREQQRYIISQKDIDTYEREVIPYWNGRTMRERIFSHVPQEWKAAYEAGVFTEFMEQRAPGHTALDGKIYQRGMLDFKKEIREHIQRLDFLNDPEATDKLEELHAMNISCDAAILFAERHADLVERMAQNETEPQRRKELKQIAEVCRRVPAHAPRNLWEAIQMYWFVHLGTITELNGWDAMNPGHFDQHLQPFYEKEITEGTLTRDQAKELISCFWIKVNNHPAPPKVGITTRESGTYNDLLAAIDGKPNVKGGQYHLNMLSTTCHVYFGKVLGATPNGRFSCKSISDGTSPLHGCDTHGPTAVVRSLGKLDQVKSGGTLLNLRFVPSLLKREKDVEKLGHLIRSYFTLGGHHIQFNIVDTANLLAAQACPEDYRDLMVRMAGYSDYFNDMNADLQQEIIERTENEGF